MSLPGHAVSVYCVEPENRKCVEQRRLNIDLTPLQEQSATCSALKAYTYLYSCIDTLFTAGKLYGAVT